MKRKTIFLLLLILTLELTPDLRAQTSAEIKETKREYSQENPWVKDLKRVKIPVSEDVSVLESQPDKGFPFALGAHPYTSPIEGEQMILLQFPLRDKNNNWYVPKSAYIYQVALHLYEVAGFSKGKKTIHIQLFQLGDFQTQKFNQEKVTWRTMPKLASPFFTAEIPITVSPLSLFDIKGGFNTFHSISEYEYASFAIRVPPFEKGYIQFADKDSLYKDRTPASLIIWYLDYPLPTPTTTRIPPEAPYDINAYFDRLTNWVIVSWKTDYNVNKVQIERKWTNINRYFGFRGDINTYNDLDVYNSYLVYHPQSSITYGIRTCNDASFNDNNCLYASKTVETSPVKLPPEIVYKLSPHQPSKLISPPPFSSPSPSPSPFPPTSTRSPSQPSRLTTPPARDDEFYREKIRQFEERIKNQEKKIKSLQKETKKQKKLLERILSFLKKIFFSFFNFKPSE